MQRRATTYATGLGLALVLFGGLTACSSSSEDGSGGDAKADGSGVSAPAAPPGRYRTLPEPCGAVSLNTLKSALPGARHAAADASTPPGATPAPYAGKASLTYDTDRRVGCHWASSTSLQSRHLSIDMERVVSYDNSVSDDKQAQELYLARAKKAGIPDAGGSGSNGGSALASPSASPSGSPSGRAGARSAADDPKASAKATSKASDKTSDKPSPKASGKASGKASDQPSASASPSASSAADLAPRRLDDVGDDAYIDDNADSADSGGHRDITLVFRSANVIATVRYSEWPTDKRVVPDSAELQQVARTVARELAADLDAD